MVRSFFPSFFSEVSAVSANFGGIVIEKSAVNPNCVIIRGERPLSFLMEHLAHLNFSPEWIDAVEIRYNTDGISVFDKKEAPKNGVSSVKAVIEKQYSLNGIGRFTRVLLKNAQGETLLKIDVKTGDKAEAKVEALRQYENQKPKQAAQPEQEEREPDRMEEFFGHKSSRTFF